MRQKPVEPERTLEMEDYICLEDFASLFDIVENIKGFNVDLKNVETHSSEENDYFKFTRQETDEEFNERMDKYNKELESYNKWYSVNKDKIEQYEAEQKIIDEEKRKRNEIIQEKRAEAKRKKLLKQQKEIQKELEKLGVK